MIRVECDVEERPHERRTRVGRTGEELDDDRGQQTEVGAPSRFDARDKKLERRWRRQRQNQTRDRREDRANKAQKARSHEHDSAKRIVN
jgi:rRNA maturation protein Nop10